MKPMMKRKILIVSALVITIAAILFYLLHFAHGQLTRYTQKRRLFENLTQALQEEFKNQDGSCAVVIQDLTLPEFMLDYQGNEPVVAASVIKIPILAVVAGALNEGKVALDQKVTIVRRDITGGSGVIKAMKVPVDFTFEQLLELMITRSDNTATNKVIDLLGMDYINEGFKQLGLIHTRLERKMMDFVSRRKGKENYTSADEVGRLLVKMYQGTLVNQAYSEMMIGLLQQQKVNDRIPRYLPKGTVVAHKTGLEKGVLHDAGIVFAPFGDYLICVFCRDVKSYNRAKKFIAQLSLVTYNLYQAQHSN